MYSHELADALKKLATALKKGPNIEIDQLQLPSIMGAPQSSDKRSVSRGEDIPMALSALLSLSLVDKKEWAMLITELNLKIPVRPRDASRDLLGKVLKALEADPVARMRLSNTVKARQVHSSPELARALSSLLDK